MIPKSNELDKCYESGSYSPLQPDDTWHVSVYFVS